MDYSGLKVLATADVVVCGGGTAGAFAAMAAADMMDVKDVLIIEQFGSLGGTATNGLVTPVMHTHIKSNPQCSYLSEKLRERLYAVGGCDASGAKFDPLLLKMILEEMCDVDSKCRFMYHTFIADAVVSDGKVDSIVVCNKDGLGLVKGKIFIDCTGDADVCVRAGAGYTHGNPQTGANQPVSLRYVISGIDFEKFGSYLLEEVKRTGVDSAASYDGKDTIYAACCAAGKWTLDDVFFRAIEAGDLLELDKSYWQIFSIPGRPGCLAYNNPEFFDRYDAADNDTLTSIQVQGKSTILRQLKFYKKYFPGFEGAYLSEVASMVGVRESRNVECEYVLTAQDLLCRSKFRDMFCQSNYPVDIHGKTLNFDISAFKPVDDGKPWYEIPFRSLVVKGFDNLLVAGRCLGAEFLAQSSLRVQQSVRSSGEAAGIGAVLALNRGVPIREIDGAEVREIMISKGAIFA